MTVTAVQPSIPQLSPERRATMRRNWPNMTPDAKRRALKVLQAYKDYPKDHPTLAYIPHEQPLSFHLAPNKGRGLFGGNRSGKTEGLCAEYAMHATGEYPDWFPDNLRMKQPVRIRMVATDFSKGIDEDLEPKFEKYIPDYMIAKKQRSTQQHLAKLILKNGSTIDFMTHEQPTQYFEGWSGDLAGFNEPPPRDRFVATMRGLVDRKGRWAIAATPLQEAWMFDEVYLNPKHHCVTMTIWDNPHISRAEIDEFASMLTEDEKEARLYGKFRHLAGLVYKEFDPDLHIIPYFKPDNDWPIWCVMDPHDRKPFCIGWFAVAPNDDVYMFREYPQQLTHQISSSAKTPKDYAIVIKDLEGEGEENVVRRIIDARFGNAPKATSYETVRDQFDKHGLTFDNSYMTRTLGEGDPGHQKIHEYLRKSFVTGRPKLYIMENCTNTVYAFQHYVWDKDKEKPKDAFKDWMDVVRYGLMDGMRYLGYNDNAKRNEGWLRSYHDNIKRPRRKRWQKSDEELAFANNRGGYGSEV